jgi:hypothetical protein
MIRLKRLRWAENVAYLGEGRGAYRVLMENLSKGDHLKESDVDGKIILK